MTSSTSSSSVAAARVAAVLAPAAIVGVVLGWLGRPDTPASAEAEVPAEIATCRKAMERSGGEVVVVGNSKSGTDIDRVALAKALGVRGVGAVGKPGSSAPLWYAALERCVFEAGYQPRLVVVYATPGATLRATLDSERERLALAPFLGASEPVLDQKVFGGAPASPLWQRVRTRKTELVLGLQHGVRDTVAGVFFAPAGPEGTLAAGRAYAEPALEKVLGADAGADAVSRHRAIPIAEAGADASAARDLTIADTLVPDLVALATTHGARVVFVRAPVAKGSFDAVDPELLREMVAALNERGAGWLDLSGLGLPASSYGDGVHMNNAGRAALTTALAAGLGELDALGAGSFAPAALPRAPAKLSRTGPLPALPVATAPTRGPWDCGWSITIKGLEGVSDSALARLGAGAVSPLVLLEDGAPLQPHAKRDAFDLACAGAFNHQGPFVKFSPTGGPAEVVASRTYTTGLSEALPLVDATGREAWWVYPGTSLRADAPEAWNGAAEGFAVRIEALVAIPGATPATVAWTTEAPLGVDGAVTLAGPAPTAPWSVEVRSPPDGPWLLVQRVVAGTEAAPWYLLGTADTGASVDLLGAEATYAAPPPAIGALGPVTATKDGWLLDSSALTAPDGDAISRASGISRCAPVRIFEDGVPLAAPNTGLVKLPTIDGAYAHTTAGIRFTSSDRSDPLENGRAYTAALEPSRVACHQARWLYPGDVVRFRVPTKALAAFAREARLHLTAVPIGAPGSVLTARVFVDGAEVATTAVPLGAATPDAALPALPATGAVEVELSLTADAPFTLLTALALTEPPRPAFPSTPLADGSP